MRPLLKKIAQPRTVTGSPTLTALYALLIVHMSLYPYAGWSHIGIGPWEYLSGPWIPVHQTILWDDIALNFLGYLPLGFLMFMAMPRLPLRLEFLLLLALPLTLSFGLEALQTWLPTRVPSKVDVLTNAAGAWVGSGLAMLVSARGSWIHKVNLTLQQWVVRGSWLGFGLICLWFFSLLAPRYPEFTLGLWLGNLSSAPWAEEAWIPLKLLPDEWALWAEAWVPQISSGLMLLGATLTGLTQVRAQSPRFRLAVLFLLLTLLINPLHHLATGQDFPWSVVLGQTAQALPEVGAGLLLIILMLKWRLEPSTLAMMAAVCLVFGWLMTALLPGVYDPDLLQGGHGAVRAFRDIQQAARWTGEFWPPVAIVILLSTARLRQ